MEVAKSLDDIFLPEEGMIEIPRKGGNLGIPIRPISYRRHREIVRKNQPPSPPMQTKRDAGGRVTGLEPNPLDPVYVEKLAQLEDDRVRDFALAGINLPGLDETTWDKFADTLTTYDLNTIMDAVNVLSESKSAEVAEQVKNS